MGVCHTPNAGLRGQRWNENVYMDNLVVLMDIDIKNVCNHENESCQQYMHQRWWNVQILQSMMDLRITWYKCSSPWDIVLLGYKGQNWNRTQNQCKPSGDIAYMNQVCRSKVKAALVIPKLIHTKTDCQFTWHKCSALIRHSVLYKIKFPLSKATCKGPKWGKKMRIWVLIMNCENLM
jgi:hypothetical protein